MSKYWCFLAGGMLALGALAPGCSNPAEGKANVNDAAVTPEVLTIPVEAARPTRDNLSAFLDTQARIEAERRVEVIAQGMGECIGVKVEEGDTVTAGQVLAELDKEELEAQLRQTRVNIRQQEHALSIAERSLAEGIGSQIERDNARFALDQAQATLNAQEIQIRNQTITSPINGIITRRNIQQGSMVTSAVPAFTIVDPASYILPINVPERELGNLRLGQEARVNIDSMPGKTLMARVDRISPSVDPVSGTVRVLLSFDAADQNLLRESAFARVRLVTETRADVLVLPKDSIIEDSTRKYVMVVRESQEGGEAFQVAERVEIQTGLEDGSQVEVLGGVEEDTPVVTLGQHTLKEGARGTITNARESIAARATITPEQALETAKGREMRVGRTRPNQREGIAR